MVEPQVLFSVQAFMLVYGAVLVAGTMALLLTGLALLLFVGLYLLQALILARPQGALSQRLYPLAFAGFYLDEYFTRLTFRLWPVRSPQPLTSPTGDRP